MDVVEPAEYASRVLRNCRSPSGRTLGRHHRGRQRGERLRNLRLEPWIQASRQYIGPADATSAGEYSVASHGVTDASVTQASIQQTICPKGYSSARRQALYPSSASDADNERHIASPASDYNVGATPKEAVAMACPSRPRLTSALASAEDTPGSSMAEAAELEGVARRRGHGRVLGRAGGCPRRSLNDAGA
jgi:hypothetical protein